MRGDRLRDLRKAKGLSQDDLAERVGLSKQQLYRIENGKSANPGADLLVQLAKELECSIDYLVGLVDEPSDHYRKQDLTPLQERLLWAVDKGLIYEAIETVTSLSKKSN